MKKIICTVTNDLTFDQRMIRISTTLSKAGYAVLLVGRNKKNALPLKNQPFQQKRLPCFFQKGKLFYLEYQVRLFFFLLFSRFDLLYSVDLDTLLPAVFIKLLKRRKFIFDAHEYFTETPEVERRPLVKKTWETIAALAIPAASGWITVSDSLRQVLTRRYCVPFELVRNVPANKYFLEDVTRASPPVILYQGYLNEGRGLECAIDALKWVYDAELWLIGEGDITDQLKKQVVEAGLEDRVRFFGFMLPEKLHQTTIQASIGLNLLEARSKSYFYSLANKTFDYIQAGLPAIHMDFPEYRVLLEQFRVGRLLPGLQPENLAAILKEMLNQPLEYNLMETACREAATYFTWEKEQKTLLSYIDKVL